MSIGWVASWTRWCATGVPVATSVLSGAFCAGHIVIAVGKEMVHELTATWYNPFALPLSGGEILVCVVVMQKICPKRCLMVPSYR